MHTLQLATELDFRLEESLDLSLALLRQRNGMRRAIKPFEHLCRIAANIWRVPVDLKRVLRRVEVSHASRKVRLSSADPPGELRFGNRFGQDIALTVVSAIVLRSFDGAPIRIDPKGLSLDRTPG